MKTLFKNRKAFTLIELIAVVSILGVLVLLAVPNFASHVGKAHEAHITNDIIFFESAIAAEKLKGNKDITAPWHTVTPEQMGTLMTEEVLYDKDGIVKAEEEFDGLLSIIEDNLIRSHLEGQFYVTLEGKVYYNDGADLVGEEPIIPEVPEPIDPTPNEDFTFIESSNTNAYTGPGGVKGYFKYVGTGDEVVKIPHHIEGIELTSYFSMFSETGDDVRKVISTNDNITNMSHMFADFGGAPLDITEINSKNVTNMSSMFEGYRAFLVDLSGLDTSSVENMSSMFAHTSAMTLDMTSFDTSNVTNMNRMFYDSSASNLDLSTFNTANVKSMSYMFGDALATSINTSNFDTSKVYDMSGMYSNSKLNNIDVSHFDSSSLTNIAGMFHGVNLAELDLSAIDFTNIDTMNGFYTYNASGQGGNGHGLF